MVSLLNPNKDIVVDVVNTLENGGPNFRVHVTFYDSSITISLVNPMNGIMLKDDFSRKRGELFLEHLHPLRKNATGTRAQFMYEVERYANLFFTLLREYKGFIALDRNGTEDTNIYEDQSKACGERV